MYEIVYHFLEAYLFGTESVLIPILTDFTMILFYVALVNMLLWVYKVASKVIKL